MTNKLAILGSTGSIGVQALEVCAHLGISVVALAARANIGLLEDQIRRFKPELAVVADEGLAGRLRVSVADTTTRVEGGTEALESVATHLQADTVLTSMVGSAGLRPTMAAILARKRIALANKETLVVAGSVIMPMARQMGVEIVPVDSEHSALFQALSGHRAEDVEKLVLTASGGPFRGYDAASLAQVTREQALKHPNWQMGGKITIDSATMMNKGLEIIEARWLFDVPAERIDVLVHPQSIVHSLVAYRDGSLIAQMGAPDMRVPIQLALTWPSHRENPFRRVDLAALGTLTFEQPDEGVFRCLALAREAIRQDGTMPAVMNAANEVAVAALLEGKLPFAQIPDVVESAMASHAVISASDVETILEADREGRAYAEEYMRGRKAR